MPITIPAPGITIPSGGNALVDLATYDFVVNLLAAGGLVVNPAQQLVVPALITAASREMIRWCGNRLFVAQPFMEIVTPEGERQDRREVASAKLQGFPVLDVTRCATGRTGALVVSNTDTATNQDAWVQLVTAGDVQYPDLAYSGLALTRVASGTQTTVTVSWSVTSPFTTIQSVADAINSLGDGWLATVQSGDGAPSLARLPAFWLVGAREPKGALSPGATLDVFQTTFGSYDIDRGSGIMRFYGLGGYGGFGFGGGWGWDGPGDGYGGYGGCAGGYGQVHVMYRMGFETVPEPLQRCCAEVVKAAMERLATDSALKTENAGDYSYAVRDSWQSLPDWCRETMTLYRDWKV